MPIGFASDRPGAREAIILVPASDGTFADVFTRMLMAGVRW